jgi:hypothetical protein
MKVLGWIAGRTQIASKSGASSNCSSLLRIRVRPGLFVTLPCSVFLAPANGCEANPARSPVLDASEQSQHLLTSVRGVGHFVRDTLQATAVRPSSE